MLQTAQVFDRLVSAQFRSFASVKGHPAATLPIDGVQILEEDRRLGLLH